MRRLLIGAVALALLGLALLMAADRNVRAQIYALPAAAACLVTPGSTTAGWVVSWGSTTGCSLATGYPVGNSGVNTVLETDSGGHIDASTIPTSVVQGPGSSTDGYVARWSGTSGAHLATGTPVGNAGINTILETGSTGVVDQSVIPAPFVKGPGSSNDGWVVRWSGTGGTQLAGGNAISNGGANTLPQSDSSGQLVWNGNVLAGGAYMGAGELATATSNSLCYYLNYISGYYVLANCSSLRALKDDIRPLELGLRDIAKLRPKSYISKTSGRREIGLIAEDVAAAVPLLATYDHGKLIGVDYPHLTALLVAGMQQQQREIDDLRLAHRKRRAGLAVHRIGYQ